MKLAATLAAGTAFLSTAMAAQGRVMLPERMQGYTVKSAKSLRKLLENNLRDGTVEPLVYSTLSFPKGHDKIDALGPIFGTNFVVKGEATHTVTAFARHTLIDRIIEVHGQNLGAYDDGDEEHLAEGESDDESVALDFSIISDVPSLMHFNNKYVAQTPATVSLPFHEALRGIQKDLAESIASLDTINVKLLRIPSHWKGFVVKDECDKLLVLEAAAIQRVREAIPLAAEESAKPVALITLTQGLTCYADKDEDTTRLYKGIELLQKSLPPSTIKTVVPTEVWAGIETVESMAREISGLPARRRLQGIEAQLHDDLMWIEREAVLQQAIEDNDDIVGEKTKKKKTSRDAGEDLTFVKIERKQIILWTTIALVVTMALSVWAVLDMPLNKDPLLYTRIYTGH